MKINLKQLLVKFSIFLIVVQSAVGFMLINPLSAKAAEFPVTTASVNPPSPDGTNGWYKTNPVITLSATGDVGTLKTYYHLDSGTDGLYSASVSILNGEHSITYHSEDMNGSGITSSQNFKVDTSNPVMPNSVSDGGDYTADPHLAVSWNDATDIYSGVGEYILRVRKNSTTTNLIESINLDNDVTSYTLNDTEAAKLQTGNMYYSCIEAVDNAGRNSVSRCSDGINLDQSAPSDTSVSINLGAAYTKNQTVSLGLSATDSFVPITMMLSNDSEFTTGALNAKYGGWIDFTPTVSDWNLLSGDGTKTVYAKFKDGGENVSTPTYATIILDITTPTINSVSSTPNTTGSSMTITATVTDAISVPVVQISVDGGSSYNSMVSIGSNQYTFPKDVPLNSTIEMPYTIMAEDDAGNISTFDGVIKPNAVTKVYNLDLTTPIVANSVDTYLKIEGITGTGTITIEQYPKGSPPNGGTPNGGTVIGVDGLYYNISVSTPTSINFPVKIEIKYSDDSTAPNYLNESKFVSLYYYDIATSTWKDYQLDIPTPSIVTIDPVANIISATLQHLTPIVPVIDITPPTAPQISSSSAVGKTIDLQWGAVTDAAYYYVYSTSKANGFITTSSSGVRSDKIYGTKYTLNVGGYGDYYVVVTAVDKYGNESAIPTDTSKELLVSVFAPAVTTAPTEPTTTPEAIINNFEEAFIPTAEAATKTDDKTANQDQKGEVKSDSNKNDDNNNNRNRNLLVVIALLAIAGAAYYGYKRLPESDEISQTTKTETPKTPHKNEKIDKTNKPDNFKQKKR